MCGIILSNRIFIVYIFANVRIPFMENIVKNILAQISALKIHVSDLIHAQNVMMDGRDRIAKHQNAKKIKNVLLIVTYFQIECEIRNENRICSCDKNSLGENCNLKCKNNCINGMCKYILVFKELNRGLYDAYAQKDIMGRCVNIKVFKYL